MAIKENVGIQNILRFLNCCLASLVILFSINSNADPACNRLLRQVAPQSASSTAMVRKLRGLGYDPAIAARMVSQDTELARLIIQKLAVPIKMSSVSDNDENFSVAY